MSIHVQCMYTHVHVSPICTWPVCVCTLHVYIIHVCIIYIVKCTHAGKDETLDTADHGMTHAVVMRLVDPVKERGHHVYLDNFYTSPALFADLHCHGFGACGTVRTDRRGLPPCMKQKKMRKGEKKCLQVDQHTTAIQWNDKRVVSMLTTIHSDDVVAVQRRSRLAPSGREEVEKPLAISEYNKYMGGVDRGDQLLSYYGYSHRTIKWWKRAFFFLFDMAVVNAYILYVDRNPNKRTRLTHEQFRITLAKQLLESAGIPVDSSSEQNTLGPHPNPLQPAARLHERHFPTTIGRTQADRPIQQDCNVCSKRKGAGRKTTTYKCKQCDLPMCIVPCFELWHTKSDPHRYI